MDCAERPSGAGDAIVMMRDILFVEIDDHEKPGPQAEYSFNSLAANTLSRGLDVPRWARRQDYFKDHPVARWWWGLTGH